MKKYLKSVMSTLFPKELPKHMGRWRIENDTIQTNNKIDLSNEDHCGPCGHYALSKIEFKKKQMKKYKSQKDIHFEKKTNF